VKTVLYFPANDFKLILAFRNPPTADKIGFELGLFIRGLKVVHFHNPFVKKHLRSFQAFNEIGFVFLGRKAVSFS